LPPFDEQVSKQRDWATRKICAEAIDGALDRRYLLRVRHGFSRSGKMPMRIVYFVCWLVLLAGALAFRLDGAAAQGSDAARDACTPDAMRLCAEFVPDVAKTTACMKRKYSQLSAPCRIAMRGGARHGTHHRQYRHCQHCG
jgi:hypothetical protein